MIGNASARPSSASVCSTFSFGAEVASAIGMPSLLEPLDQRGKPLIGASRPRDSSRYRPSFSCSYASHSSRGLALEQDREDLAVAPAIEPRAIVLRQRRQAVALREHREGLGVQVHVVDDGAVDIEDDGARSKAKRHS